MGRAQKINDNTFFFLDFYGQSAVLKVGTKWANGHKSGRNFTIVKQIHLKIWSLPVLPILTKNKSGQKKLKIRAPANAETLIFTEFS